MEYTYQEDWDRPHTPSSDAMWQESDCYWFYDPAAQLGGFHRIGQKPNKGTGQLMLFVFKIGGERFVLNSAPRNEVALGPDARQSHKQVVGNHTAESLGEGRMRYTWEEPETSADIEFYQSFHAPRNWPSTNKGSVDFEKTINSDGHLECGGRLRGTIRIGTETYTIDALAHRDRSWGKRSDFAPQMHRYRMYSGTCGEALSFASFYLDFNEFQAVSMGYVDRHGKQDDVVNLRVATTFDYDGVTPLSSVGVLTLASGEKLRIESKVVQGFLTPMPGVLNHSQDNISIFEYEGHTGFVDLEMSTNPGRGEYTPTQADVSFLAVAEGLSPSVDYEF